MHGRTNAPRTFREDLDELRRVAKRSLAFWRRTIAVLVVAAIATVALIVKTPAIYRSETLILYQEAILASRRFQEGDLDTRFVEDFGSLADHEGLGLGVQRPVLGDGGGETRGGQGALECCHVGGADDGPVGPQELCLRALGDDLSLADHHDVVGDDLDLGEQVG